MVRVVRGELELKPTRASSVVVELQASKQSERAWKGGGGGVCMTLVSVPIVHPPFGLRRFVSTRTRGQERQLDGFRVHTYIHSAMG